MFYFNKALRIHLLTNLDISWVFV